MLRFAFSLLFVAVLGAPVASACSCVINDREAVAEREFSEADLVFKGYMLDAQLTPMKVCTKYDRPRDPFRPIGSFKIVESYKGAASGDVVIAHLNGVSSVSYNSHCEFEQGMNTCNGDFVPGMFGTPEDPIWIVLTLRNGLLWTQLQNCSAFSEHAEELVNRISNRSER